MSFDRKTLYTVGLFWWFQLFSQQSVKSPRQWHIYDFIVIVYYWNLLMSDSIRQLLLLVFSSDFALMFKWAVQYKVELDGKDEKWDDNSEARLKLHGLCRRPHNEVPPCFIFWVHLPSLIYWSWGEAVFSLFHGNIDTPNFKLQSRVSEDGGDSVLCSGPTSAVTVMWDQTWDPLVTSCFNHRATLQLGCHNGKRDVLKKKVRITPANKTTRMPSGPYSLCQLIKCLNCRWE